MSYDRGLAVLRDPFYDGPVPVMEHMTGLSRDVVVHFSGIDPLAEPGRVNEAFRRLAERFEVDLLWGSGLPDETAEVFDWDHGPSVRRNRAGLDVVQWGVFGTVHQEDGRHLSDVPKPASVDEALDFQPLQFFPNTVEEYREQFTQQYQRMCDSTGSLCYPIPYHYTTLFHWPLAIFGFELLCLAGVEEDRFAELVARFAQVTRRITDAWAQVPGLEAFILHDDLTMTSGPIFHPDWYRRHIFVHYPMIFEPLKKANVPIIFTSDGDCSMFTDDIFEAGADGLNFEYMVDLARLVRDHGDRILIGNINSRVLAAGPLDAIEHAVHRCLSIGAAAPRFVVNVGGQLTHDIPVAHLEHYLAVRSDLCRRVRR